MLMSLVLCLSLKWKPGLRIKNSRQIQIEERQSAGIHDVLNAQGFPMHCRAISNTVAISKFSDMRRMFTGFTAKIKDGLTVLALFNFCPKVKKVLHQIWRSSW